ncbi:MAG: hypothetical protein VX593_07900 [Pseudomonadota bacterium]|nr:hypothetical protein [Pseudomonadota bacterium]
MSGRARETAELVSEKISALQVFDDVLLNAKTRNISNSQQRRVELVIRLAQENAQHFTAVRNGLKSAINRIGAKAENSYVGAYNAAGGQTPFRNATGGYVKKV